MGPREGRVPRSRRHVALHVERYDGDPAAVPFVLVHGLASNLRLWDAVAERLHARGHTVIALDQRGHGRSDAPQSEYGNDVAVRDLIALVETLGLRRPILAGQSWGWQRGSSWPGATPTSPRASSASMAGSSSLPIPTHPGKRAGPPSRRRPSAT